MFVRRAVAVAAVLLILPVSRAATEAPSFAEPPFSGAPQGPTTVHTPIGLAIDIEEGIGQPLSVRANQTLYINQIDLRAHAETTVDEGVGGLAKTGDFAHPDWRGTKQVDQSFLNQANPDGTFTRRRFYRDSNWMNVPSLFVIEQLDRRGIQRGFPVSVSDGLPNLRTTGPADAFFARRLRGIQWANNCASKTDCTGATSFLDEVLVELRYASGPQALLQIDPATTQLRVTWTANPGHPYTIPVTQVARPEWDYGLNIDLKVKEAPHADGTYHPGDTLHIAFTLTDGAGKELAPGGVLPTFDDYLSGNDPPGIDYWNQAEPHITYYRRKHRERQLFATVIGPMQNVAPLRRSYDFISAILASTENSLVIATPAADGIFAAASLVPNGLVLLGALPTTTPVGNTFPVTLPADAQPGTYKIALKARRTYLGQDLPRAAVLSIQVGTRQVTHSALTTGHCEGCHTGAVDLVNVNHGFSVNDRDVCATCHVPLLFEPEGPIYVRLHFIHSRSGRLDASPGQCSLCHLSNAGIQRTSKSACLSCHTSYPEDHVARYGPVTDMYIGTSLEEQGGLIGSAFQPCATSCHTTHPRSGLF